MQTKIDRSSKIDTFKMANNWVSRRIREWRDNVAMVAQALKKRSSCKTFIFHLCTYNDQYSDELG